MESSFVTAEILGRSRVARAPRRRAAPSVLAVSVLFRCVLSAEATLRNRASLRCRDDLPRSPHGRPARMRSSRVASRPVGLFSASRRWRRSTRLAPAVLGGRWRRPVWRPIPPSRQSAKAHTSSPTKLQAKAAPPRLHRPTSGDFLATLARPRPPESARSAKPKTPMRASAQPAIPRSIGGAAPATGKRPSGLVGVVCFSAPTRLPSLRAAGDLYSANRARFGAETILVLNESARKSIGPADPQQDKRCYHQDLRRRPHGFARPGVFSGNQHDSP